MATQPNTPQPPSGAKSPGVEVTPPRLFTLSQLREAGIRLRNRLEQNGWNPLDLKGASLTSLVFDLEEELKALPTFLANPGPAEEPPTGCSTLSARTWLMPASRLTVWQCSWGTKA